MDVNGRSILCWSGVYTVYSSIRSEFRVWTEGDGGRGVVGDNEEDSLGGMRYYVLCLSLFIR